MLAALWQNQQNDCAPSEDSDQPGPESSLCAQWVAKDSSFLHADSEDSDQTGRMLGAHAIFGRGEMGLIVFKD